MAQPFKPITVVIDTPEKLTAIQCCLEWGYDSIREHFADGSGESSPEQDACNELMKAVKVR